jgi:hypothetical protein
MDKRHQQLFPHQTYNNVMTFEEWQKTFQRSFRARHGKLARGAFDAWCKKVRAMQEWASRLSYLEKLPIGHPWNTAPEIYVSKRIYYGTLPPSQEDSRTRQNLRKRDKYTCKELYSLASHAEQFVAHLWSAGPEILSEDEYFTLNLWPVLQSYKEAAQSSRVALSLLQRPYLHKRDILDQCIGLLATLINGRYGKGSKGIPIPQAVALVYLALLAHGYKEEQLASLDPLKARDGNVRKRLGSRTRSVVAVANLISAQTRKK